MPNTLRKLSSMHTMRRDACDLEDTWLSIIIAPSIIGLQEGLNSA